LADARDTGALAETRLAAIILLAWVEEERRRTTGASVVLLFRIRGEIGRRVWGSERV
jgi:hypothetical protein